MTIDCDKPRPKLQQPNREQAALSWQPPAYIPPDAESMQRVLTDALAAIHQELRKLATKGAIVPLVEDTLARPGQVIKGTASGEVITLLAPAPGEESEPVTVVISDVVTAVTVVDQNGNEATVAVSGVYEFWPDAIGGFQLPPGTASPIGAGVTSDRLLGRDSPGTGAVEQLTADGGIEFTGSGGIQRSAISGDITVAAGSNTSAITSGVIVNADVNASAGIAVSKLADQAAGTTLGVQVDGSTGPPVALTGQEQVENLRWDTVETVVFGATEDDYAFGNIDTLGIALCSSAGASEFTGITPPASNDEGKRVLFVWTSDNTLTIPHDDSNSAAGSRILCPDSVDYTARRGCAFWLVYDASAWRIEDSAVFDSTTRGPVPLSGGDSDHYINAAGSWGVIPMTATGALTGDVTKSSGSTTTAIAAGVIVNADVSASAAIATSKLGALTSEVTKPSGSTATTVLRSTNFTWTGSHRFDDSVGFNAIHSQAMTAAIDDLAIGEVNAVRLTPDAGWDLTGMVPDTLGQVVMLCNIDGTNSVNLQREDSGSSAANRFALRVTTLGLGPGQMFVCWYDSTSARWRVAD